MPLVDAVTPPSSPRGYLKEVVSVTGDTTLTENHRDRTLLVNSGSAVTLTLPNDLLIGFHCEVIQLGAGQAVFSAASGATLSGSSDRTRAQYSCAQITLTGQNAVHGLAAVYVLAGDVTDSSGETTATVAELNLLDGVAATVDIALAAGAADTMDVTLTVEDAAGAAIEEVHCLEVWISEAATGIGLTGDTYSGGLTVTTGSELQEIVSTKHYELLTDEAGVIVFSIEDSGQPADQYVVVKHPMNGKLIVSAASGTSWGAP